MADTGFVVQMFAGDGWKSQFMYYFTCHWALSQYTGAAHMRLDKAHAGNLIIEAIRTMPESLIQRDLAGLTASFDVDTNTAKVSLVVPFRKNNSNEWQGMSMAAQSKETDSPFDGKTEVAELIRDLGRVNLYTQAAYKLASAALVFISVKSVDTSPLGLTSVTTVIGTARNTEAITPAEEKRRVR